MLHLCIGFTRGGGGLEERDELWGWHVVEEDPTQREREMNQERMANGLRETEAFIAGVVEAVEAAGARKENG
jgi:hypothetical protein